MYLGISGALLIINGYLGTRLIGLQSFLDRFIGTFLLAISQIIIISLTVGMIPGGYRPIPLVITTAIIFIVLIVQCIIRKCLFIEKQADFEKEYIKSFILVVIVTLPIWIWQFFNGILLPPYLDDELYYHLFYVGAWANDGYISFFITSNPFVNGYPQNLELLSGWTMVTTETDVWADLLGLPFVFLGIAIVIAFSKKLNISPKNSFWAGILFATTPMVIFHSKAAYIDLPLSVLFGAVIYFLFIYVKEGSLKYLIIGAIGMGIIVGSKYSGLYMAIVSLVPIIYKWYIDRNRLFKPSLLKILLYFSIPIIILGSFFYIKNIIIYGSPIYPMILQILGITVFDGLYLMDAFNFTYYENSWLTLIKSIIGTDPYPRYDSYYSGYGPQLILLAIPSFFLFLIKEKKWRVSIIVLLLIPILITVVTLPAKYPRYLIYIMILLVPFIGWMFDKLSLLSSSLLKILAVCSLIYSTVIATPFFEIDTEAYNISASTVWSANEVTEEQTYNYISIFNDLKGDSLQIASVFTIRPYLILGDNWQNEIFYFKPVDEELWINEIIDNNIDIFIFEPLKMYNRESYLIEEKWINRHPEYFELVYSGLSIYNNPFYVYLIIPGSSEHRVFVDKVNSYFKEVDE